VEKIFFQSIRKSFVITMFLFTLCFIVGEVFAQADNLKNLFEQKYQNWVEYIAKPEVMLSSSSDSYVNNEAFNEIVRLGPMVLPYLIDKIRQKEEESKWLPIAIKKISKFKVEAKWDKMQNKFVYNDFPDLAAEENVYVYWWEKERKLIPNRVLKLYNDRQLLKTQKNINGVKQEDLKIKELGIAVLPFLMDKIRDGNTDLIPIVSELTDGKIAESSTVVECLAWWSKNKSEWNILNE
jgi:hypothetical protein